jgi:peptidoglycan hydrolase-like protein with peptidoglycan-binding domain
MVVWAQERLIGAGEEAPVTGVFGSPTRSAVKAFQEAHGLPVDGQIGTTTWNALLQFTPYRERWSATAASASAVGRALPPRRPLSAGLPPKADELGALGAG